MRNLKRLGIPRALWPDLRRVAEESDYKVAWLSTDDCVIIYGCPHGERSEKGEELARLLLKHKRLEEEKKDVAKEWKERLEVSSTKIVQLSHEVKTGKADRLVDVEDRPNFKAGSIETWRMDKHHVVRARAMTPSEKNDLDQSKLFSHTGGKAKKKS